MRLFLHQSIDYIHLITCPPIPPLFINERNEPYASSPMHLKLLSVYKLLSYTFANLHLYQHPSNHPSISSLPVPVLPTDGRAAVSDPPHRLPRLAEERGHLHSRGSGAPRLLGGQQTCCQRRLPLTLGSSYSSFSSLPPSFFLPSIPISCVF